MKVKEIKQKMDVTLGINSISLAVLYLLKDYENNDEYIETGAWYNGRETGVSLTKYNKTIIFCNDRHSDSIIVYSIKSKPFVNPPTIRDHTEEDYKKRRFFNNIHEAAKYIIELLEGE